MAMLSTLFARLNHHPIELLEKKSLIYLFSIQEGSFKECLTYLSRSEVDFVSEISNETVKNQFAVSRAFLRIIIGHYLSIAPERINLQKTVYGKLFICNSPISFNIAHSAGRGVIILSRRKHCGIDIESCKRSINIHALSQRYYSNHENQWLVHQSRFLKNTSFLKIWTGKEAISKAIGLGLRLPMKTYHVIPKSGDVSWVSVPGNKLIQDGSKWLLRWFSFDSEYLCAVTVGGYNDDYTLYDRTYAKLME